MSPRVLRRSRQGRSSWGCPHSNFRSLVDLPVGTDGIPLARSGDLRQQGRPGPAAPLVHTRARGGRRRGMAKQAALGQALWRAGIPMRVVEAILAELPADPGQKPRRALSPTELQLIGRFILALRELLSEDDAFS